MSYFEFSQFYIFIDQLMIFFKVSKSYKDIFSALTF